MAKFIVTMKDPDHDTQGMPLDASRALTAHRLKDKFMQWGEYLTVEFDTATGTARVLTVKEAGE